jgi:hypothetical protein
MGSLDLDTSAGMTPGIILSAIEVLRLTVLNKMDFPHAQAAVPGGDL